MNRLTHIDVAKGLFMLIVVYYHSVCIFQNVCDGIYNANTHILFDTPNLFRAFFMAGFFFVSGMTSKFKRPIKDQIISDAKMLLLPSLIICTLTAFFYPDALDNAEMGILRMNLLFGGGAWFVTTMFCARILQKIILLIKNDKQRWATVILVGLLGCIVDRIIPTRLEFWYVPKALIFVPFIEFGMSYNKLKTKKNTIETICVLLYLILAAVLFVLGIQAPYVTGTSSLKPLVVPLFLTMAVTGSVLVYVLASKINDNKILEFIGRNTLVYYLTHMTFITMGCHLLAKHYDYLSFSMAQCTGIVVLLVLFASLWSMIFSIILNTKYLKWILGKF